MMESKMINKIWRTGAHCVAAVAGVALFASAAQAQNDFTEAGETVSNTFTLDYEVSGTAQPTVDNTGDPTDFTVDRLIDVNVAYTSQPDDSTVAPGETPTEIVFGVRNDSNDNMAYDLTAINESETDGNGAGTAPDPFDTTGGLDFWYYVDDGDGVFEPGGDDGAPVDLTGSLTDDVAPDETLWVEIRSDVPGTVNDSDFADITLVADSYYPTAWLNEAAPSAPGTEVIDDDALDGTRSDEGAAENYFADGTGTATTDSNNEGDHSDTGTLTVSSPDLEAEKTVAMIANDASTIDCSDFSVAVDTDAFFNPGGCGEYIITVTNSGSAAADITTLTDTLPDEVNFIDAEFTNFTGGTAAEPTGAAPVDCTAGACVVSQTGGSVAAGVTATIRVRFTIK